MLANEPGPTPHEAAQDERDEQRVVELTDDREEVGHEIERQREVADEPGERELPTARHPRIPQEPAEEDGAVGNEPRERPKPLAPAQIDSVCSSRHTRHIEKPARPSVTKKANASRPDTPLTSSTPRSATITPAAP